jgi:hypothetical protein
MKDIMRYLDSEGRIKAWPSKKESKIEILKYLSTKFEHNVFYTEKQANEIITNFHSFNDYFLLRRELIENKLLQRTRDCSKYWRLEEDN